MKLKALLGKNLYSKHGRSTGVWVWFYVSCDAEGMVHFLFFSPFCLLLARSSKERGNETGSLLGRPSERLGPER